MTKPDKSNFPYITEAIKRYKPRVVYMSSRLALSFSSLLHFIWHDMRLLGIHIFSLIPFLHSSFFTIAQIAWKAERAWKCRHIRFSTLLSVEYFVAFNVFIFILGRIGYKLYTAEVLLMCSNIIWYASLPFHFLIFLLLSLFLFFFFICFLPW
jgi:hypothetical protein